MIICTPNCSRVYAAQKSRTPRVRSYRQIAESSRTEILTIAWRYCSANRTRRADSTLPTPSTKAEPGLQRPPREPGCLSTPTDLCPVSPEFKFSHHQPGELPLHEHQAQFWSPTCREQRPLLVQPHEPVSAGESVPPVLLRPPAAASGVDQLPHVHMRPRFLGLHQPERTQWAGQGAAWPSPPGTELWLEMLPTQTPATQRGAVRTPPTTTHLPAISWLPPPPRCDTTNHVLASWCPLPADPH